MADSAMTVRVLALLSGASIPVTKLTDDVYGVAPAQSQAVRALLQDQPQYLKFLDRGMKAYGRQLVRLIADPAQPVRSEAWILSTLGAPGAMGISAWASSTPQQQRTSSTPTNPSTFCGLAPPSYLKKKYVYVPNPVLVGQVSIPDPVRYGDSYWSWSNTALGSMAYGSVYQYDLDSGHLADWDDASWRSQSVNYYPGGVATNAKLFLSAPTVTTVSETQTLRALGQTDVVVLDVVCGPPAAVYGEIYPSFEWYVTSPELAANVLESVVNLPTVKGSKTAVQAKIDEVRSKRIHFIAYRNRDSSLSPLDLWVSKRETVRKLADEPVSAIVKSEERLAEWNGNKWCLTATDGSSDVDVIATADDGGPAKIFVRAAVPGGEYHVTDDEGTIGMSFDAVKAFIASYPADVEIEYRELTGTYSFSAQELADWASVKATPRAAPGSGGAPPNYTFTASADDFDRVGAAVCARVLSDEKFDPREQNLLLPILVPQWLWVNYSRVVNP